MLYRCGYFIELTVWLPVGFIGTNASRYYFGRQIKQLVPSSSLIAGILLMIPTRGRSLIPEYADRILIALIVLLFPFDAFINNAYHLKHFDKTKAIAKEMGIWLRGNTSRGDYVYIATGGGNPILTYSGRLAPSRYFNTLFVTSPHERDITL